MPFACKEGEPAASGLGTFQRLEANVMGKRFEPFTALFVFFGYASAGAFGIAGFLLSTADVPGWVKLCMSGMSLGLFSIIFGITALLYKVASAKTRQSYRATSGGVGENGCH